MDLSGLLPALRDQSDYRAAVAALQNQPGSAFALGLSRAARVPVAAALAEELGGPALIVAARPDRALALVEELGAWLPGSRLIHFAEPDPLFYEQAAWNARAVRRRITALAALAAYHRRPPAAEERPIIVASARALMTRTLPRNEFLGHTHLLQAGQQLKLEQLIGGWVDIGYTPEAVVTEPGRFARRGGIIDIYPVALPYPVRIDLFGDEVESLRQFDPASQRSGQALSSVTITPAREALPRFKPADRPEPASEFDLPRMFPPASLLGYLPAQAATLIDDWQELADSVAELEEHALQFRQEQVEAGLVPDDFPLPYHPWADLRDELIERRPVFLSAQADDTHPTERLPLGRVFHAGPRFGGQLKPLLEHINELRARRESVVIVTRQAQRLAELWADHHAPVAPTEKVTTPPPAGALAFVQGVLTEGWRLEAAGQPASAVLHLLTDSEIFGWAKPEPRRRLARPIAHAPESNYADFSPGDYIVHADFGIGRFRELVRRTIDGLEREYLLIEYAEGDELYAPIYQTDRLMRYVGADENPPSLSRLGSSEWQATRTRAQEAAEAVARELLDLYAKRELAPGHAFGADTTWQAEMEAAFPYVETDDQLRAIHEVKADMERSRPMDRLICGDVGYGKTEVALRAAFKAVLDGSQVAVLVPTTVLAQQHFHTFEQRLAPYPVKVEMLSRFRSSAESKAILDRLAAGQVDIVIGTHKLLQDRVGFKNLGLLIIDEEQRFGVTHKERLKRMRTEVDVLTMTATPIPRTLYLSLTGVRDISTINTPPDERLPIITHTGLFDERLARQAILRELDRGGQVFFVHNRVQTIGLAHQRLERLAPEARVGVAHGQMNEQALSRVMDQFTDGQIDVLLCTSIIESGLDIPNANTLIVDRADTFGLAQLYQLRGRVGRGAAQAYAYFFTDRRRRPTLEARERLDTLSEQSELGAGYSIAMRDLEMRGAGDILGQRQSGHISAVGFHLYTRLLAEAVQRLKSQAPAPKPDEAQPAMQAPLEVGPGTLGVTVDLPLAISIPSDFVADRRLRLQLYRRLANVTDEIELGTLAVELVERFGPLPVPLENLLYQLRVKLRAARSGVAAIGSDMGQIVLTLADGREADRERLAYSLGIDGIRVSKNRLWLPREAEVEWRARLLDVLERMQAERGRASQPA